MLVSFVDHLIMLHVQLRFFCTLDRFHSQGALYRKPLPHFLVTATLPQHLQYQSQLREIQTGTAPHIASAYQLVFLFSVLLKFDLHITAVPKLFWFHCGLTFLPEAGNILHTVHTSCHSTLQHHNSYNRTDIYRQWNPVGSPNDGHKDARNMLRYY